MSENNQYLGYLPQQYQLKLIGELLVPGNKNKDTNTLFFEDVIELLHAQYFDSLDLKHLFILIKEYHQTYKEAPNIDNILTLVKTNVTNELEREELEARLTQISELWKKYKTNAINNDRQFIKSMTITFIKQQEISKVNKEADIKFKRGLVDGQTIYHITEQYKKIIDIGNSKNTVIDIFDRPEEILIEDYRKPIGTGIKEIDDKIDGGISNGEIALVCAAQGVGKTSFLTLIGNNAYMDGSNVLHLILEGKRDDIRRYHYAKMFNIPGKELHKHKQFILDAIKEQKSNTKLGTLKIERLSDDITPNKLKKFILKIEEKQGYKFDLICLDYIDCLNPDEKTNNPFDGQAEVVKKIETMTEDHDWRMYLGIQAKKEANNKRVLDINDIGGSVERPKKAHLIIMVGADMSQLDNNEVNVTIAKCRFAKGGSIWEGCHFDRSVLNFKASTQFKVVEELGELLPEGQTNNYNQNKYPTKTYNNSFPSVNTFVAAKEEKPIIKQVIPPVLKIDKPIISDNNVSEKLKNNLDAINQL